MADKILPGPVDQQDLVTNGIHIHTSKIFDCCRDKDCIEDLRVYPTVSAQSLLNTAFSVRPSSATLLSADINVDAIGFNRGYYTVDVTYFYKVCGTTFPGGGDVTGLAVFDKRVILFGSEGTVKQFSSSSAGPGVSCQQPVAYVSAVDPIALNMRLQDCEGDSSERELPVIPDYILAAFGEDLVMNGGSRQLFATLGQFSIIRLERPTELTLSDADYFFPDKDCVGSSEDDPCTLFGRVRFPVEEFLPPDDLARQEDYRSLV